MAVQIVSLNSNSDLEAIMVPDFDLEESEEEALAELDNPMQALKFTEEEIALLAKAEGEEEIETGLPENFIEVVQARAPRRTKIKESASPDAISNIDSFIQEKSEAFHLSRVIQTRGGEDFVQEALDGDTPPDDEENMDTDVTPEVVQQQEELQAAKPKFTFMLGGKVYNA